MYLDQSMVLGPQQTLNISAKLIESIKILQCSAEELEQSIQQELAENPAFDAEEIPQCLRCGTPLTNGQCLTCGDDPEARALGATSADQQEWDEWNDERESFALDLSLPADEDGGYDPLSFVRTGGTLQEHLLLQLGAVLPWEDQPIAEYLIGSLDSHGYVTISVQEAAEALEVEACRVERALATLQSLDPPGIGARDLRECLLIQLRAYRELGQPHPLAERLIQDYLDELGEHHFLEIGRELNVTSTQVKRAWRFIKANLNPFPAHAFEGDAAIGSGRDQAVLVKPDVVIRRTDKGFEAEVIEERRFRFAVHPTYQTLASNGHIKVMSEGERQHIRHYTSRARFFIDCVRQRWETLQRISEALLELQADFLAKGVRYLKPLTRGELAVKVGLHESTVSRATANKYVLLPTGRTIPFDDFFDSSLATKDTLRELIETEDPRRPFSDEDLSALLNERGMAVARRTVAKYRESMRILPSRFRI